jgi:hypothetical protein
MNKQLIGNIGTAMAFIVLLIMFWYVIKHAEAFSENPCKVCEEKMPYMKCVPIVKGPLIPELYLGELNETDFT